MNSLGNHNGPSVGNIGGNLSTTGLTEYLTTQNADDGITIDEPGVYMFGQPLTVPDQDGDRYDGQVAAITITSSDVTIDLNGFSLTFGPQPVPPPGGVYDGIKIMPGVTNVTIKNGSIRGFIYGSGVNATSASAAGSNNGMIQQVVLSDLMIQENKAGVTFNGTLNAMKLMNITTSTISNNLSYGIKYSYVKTGKLSSVTASENTNSAGNAQGIWLDNCTNIDLFAVDTERNAAIGGTGYGILANTCNKINFYYSNANYNTGDTGMPNAFGFALNGSNSCTMDSNNANYNNKGFSDNVAPTTTVFVRNSALQNGNAPFAQDKTRSDNYNINIGSITTESFIRDIPIHNVNANDNAGDARNKSFW